MKKYGLDGAGLKGTRPRRANSANCSRYVREVVGETLRGRLRYSRRTRALADAIAATARKQGRRGQDHRFTRSGKVSPRLSSRSRETRCSCLLRKTSNSSTPTARPALTGFALRDLLRMSMTQLLRFGGTATWTPASGGQQKRHLPLPGRLLSANGPARRLDSDQRHRFASAHQARDAGAADGARSPRTTANAPPAQTDGRGTAPHPRRRPGLSLERRTQ